MSKSPKSRLACVWTQPKLLFFSAVSIFVLVNVVCNVSSTPYPGPGTSEYDQSQHLSNIAAATASHYVSTAAAQPRAATSGGIYYSSNDPKNYYYTDSQGGYSPNSYYSYGSGNVLSKQDIEDDGEDAVGLVGLIGLIGLAGLLPSLLPLLTPILGLLAILLLPVLLPVLGPLLLPLLLLPIIAIAAILFVPVPVVTVPATGRGSTRTSSDIDSDTARMIYNTISQEECIEKFSCQLTSAARSYGVNTDRIHGLIFGRMKDPPIPKWMQSISRGAKSTDSCKNYTCSTKLGL